MTAMLGKRRAMASVVVPSGRMAEIRGMVKNRLAVYDVEAESAALVMPAPPAHAGW
jgi:hypothetical protein